MGNAIKFTEIGYVALQITQGKEPDGDDAASNLIFSINDMGIGLTEEQIASLFQPFQQADASISRRYGGAWLGLAISRQLVTLMGGKIEVASTKGKGSCFSFDLPFVRLEERRRLMDHDLSGIHIVAVAGHEPARVALESYFQSLDAQCTIARSDGDVVRQLRGRPAGLAKIDAVIFHDLPFEAPELLELLDEDEELGEVPLICADHSHAGQRLDHGAMRHPVITLPLPFKRAQICRTVAELVGRLSPEDREGGVRRAEGRRDDTKFSPPPVDEALAQGALILVAEDNPTNQTVIRTLLNRLGYAAEIAEDGRQALEWFQAKPSGLLLSDCHMPELDGYQLSSEISRLQEGSDKRLPIVALTADALAETSDRCLEAGMDGYLAKPVNIADLDNTIQHRLPQAAGFRRPAEAQKPALVSQSVPAA